MTKDPLLKPFAKSRDRLIQRGVQGPNGSWGYSSGQDGDTSIVGWQVQALKAAQLSKDLVVSDAVIKKAVKFLELAAAGPKKAMYGYRDNKDAQPSTARTAVGLLSRYYIDGWGPNNPGMIEWRQRTDEETALVHGRGPGHEAAGTQGHVLLLLRNTGCSLLRRGRLEDLERRPEGQHGCTQGRDAGLAHRHTN